jgi:hypothetical protein
VKFLIRDDDTCAMTLPAELDGCYRDIWDTVPVGLSITPFRIPGTALGVPERLRGSRVPLPLSENAELVALLREGIRARRVHVAMHGYAHEHAEESTQPEYLAGIDLAAKTVDGKRYLEELLGCRVDTFVPPRNGLGLAGFAAVGAAGLHVVSNQPYPRGLGLWRTPELLVDALIAAQYGVASRLGRFGPFATRSFLRFKQAPYHTLGPQSSLGDLLEALRECHRRRGVFILSTHYHAFDRRIKSGESVREGLQAMLAEVMRFENVEFPTYSEVWESAPSWLAPWLGARSI